MKDKKLQKSSPAIERYQWPIYLALGGATVLGTFVWLTLMIVQKSFSWIPFCTLLAMLSGGVAMVLIALAGMGKPLLPTKPNSKAACLRSSRCIAILILLICGVFFLSAYNNAQDVQLVPKSQEELAGAHEKAEILAVSGGTYRGNQEFEDIPEGKQLLRVILLTGPKKGTILNDVNNLLTSGPSSSTLLKEGDTVIIHLSYDKDGNIIEQPAFYCEFDRSTPLFIIIALFILLTILVGGKVGAKSLLGLGLTVLYIFAVLIPLLLDGAETLPAIFAMCALVTVVEFLILDGFNKKTVGAILGTLSGVLFSMVFAQFAGYLLRINGFSMWEAEPAIDDLWNTKQYQVLFYGRSILLSDLLIGGVIIAALGAVNDVAMSISSSLNELIAVNPTLTRRQLFKSGMNIGRDMVGTMTNTLILALVGSSLVLMIQIYTLQPSLNQLVSGTLLSVELIQALASSIGVILAVPFTVIIGMFLFGRSSKKQ